MKAAVIHAPRNLRIEDVPVPNMGPLDVKVRIRAGGICGADLHHYQHGGFGTVRIKQPMVLGHEIAGDVQEVGRDVTRVKPGDKVAVNPSLPVNLLVAKEITLRGTFRFHEEFEWAVGFLASGAIDAAPLLTEVVPLAEAVRAFELATDKSRAMKVQLAL